MKAIFFVSLLFLVPFCGYSQYDTDPVKEEILLYPNPAKTTLWVNIRNNDISKENIAVYNILGNKLQLSVDETEEGTYTIDVNELPAGYYLLVVENESVKFARTIKFLKK